MKLYYIYLYKHIKFLKKNIVLHVLFNILSAIFSLFSVALIIPFLSIIFGTNTPQEYETVDSFSLKQIVNWLQYNIFLTSQNNGESGKFSVLLYLCIGLFVLISLKSLFSFLSIYFLAPIRSAIAQGIRNDLFEKIFNQPISFFTKSKKGQIISRFTNDVREIELSAIQLFQSLIQDPLIFLIYFSALLLLNFQLTFFIVVIIVPTLFMLQMLVKKLKNTLFIGMKKIGIITSVIDETIYTLKAIKSFNAEERKIEEFKIANSNYSQLMTKVFWKRQSIPPLSEYVMGLILIFVLWYGGSLILSNQSNFDAHEFIAFLILFFQIMPYIKRIINAVANANIGISAFDRIYKVFESEQKEENNGNIKKSEFNDSINFTNVFFAYNPQEFALKNINIKIKKGEKIAIVGKSGSGKTTLIDLIASFYTPSKGSIEIDRVNIDCLNKICLRNLIGYVTQEALFFNDSIKNNLLLAKKNATSQEISDALKVSNAFNFISELPEGIDTIIGERGTRLSGGQRQRIAIARAILKNPPIMIFDEATSSLDSESEILVQKALDELMSNRTAIVIAHRISTIINADRILVLDNGEIVEQGKHDDLVNKKNGLYKKMYELQIFQ